MRQRGFSSILLIVSLLLVAGAVGGAYYLGTQKDNSDQTNETKQPEPTSTLTSNPAPSNEDKQSNNSEKTFITTGINAGLTLKYPSEWVTQEGMFISQKAFVAGEQDRSKVYNIIGIQKYPTQLYEDYTNAEWFNKINNLTSPDDDQRETRTKLTAGKVASGESYVIFKDEPSSTAQGGAFKQVKAYILQDQTIYQLTLDLYDSNGLEVFKQLVASCVVN